MRILRWLSFIAIVVILTLIFCLYGDLAGDSVRSKIF